MTAKIANTPYGLEIRIWEDDEPNKTDFISYDKWLRSCSSYPVRKEDEPECYNILGFSEAEKKLFKLELFQGIDASIDSVRFKEVSIPLYPSRVGCRKYAFVVL
jgi:hypothetical protein